MSAPIVLLKDLLDHCQSNGWIMTCYYDSATEPDYVGTEAKEAMEALTACDEMYLKITDPTDKTQHVGVAMIVNGVEPDEQICDYGGRRLTERLSAEWKEAA